jgi:hypothetical protein
MAYVRIRTTKSGSVSTALVEAYRDEKGRPRQRLIANLHGETTVVAALAKLSVYAEGLRIERTALIEELPAALDASGRPGALMVQSKPGRELNAVTAKLAATEREMAVLVRHCQASDEEINAAAELHRKVLSDTARAALGAHYYAAQYDAAMRRLRR